MKCPYCGQEMQYGVLSGDGRSRLVFLPDGKHRSFSQWITGEGTVVAAEHDLARFNLPGDYCTQCKKLIITTELA